MNIIRLLLGNLSLAPATVKFPQQLATPANYRGAVCIDSEYCVGCGTCAYACTSGSIQVRHYEREYEWSYDLGMCTFCGRCVDYCPLHLLKMNTARPSVYSSHAQVQQVHRWPYPTCEECGAIFEPVNRILLERAFDEVSDQIVDGSRLCPKCRSERRAAEMLAVQ